MNSIYDKRIKSIFRTAKKRCVNSKSISYKYYWGKGVQFLFTGIVEFKELFLDSYINHVKEHWEKNTTLDRIDSSLHYSKDNCRWATIKEQQRNKKNPIRDFTYKWETHTQWEWIKLIWLNR